MNTEMEIIKDVSETLRKLLNDTIKPELNDPNSIVFDSPADIQQTTSTKLSLFLYKITENRHLTNHKFQQKNNSIKPPPLYLDLYYLLTPFAQTKLTEHILLSKILAACYDNSVLSGKMLWGSLNETGNKELRLVFEILTFEEIHHLWSLFPNTGYRPSLSYIVTPIQISSSRTLEIVRVLEKKVSHGIASRFDKE